MVPDSTVLIQGGIINRGRFPPDLDKGGGGDGSGKVDGGARHLVMGGRWW
jgi:hypothetical protein